MKRDGVISNKERKIYIHLTLPLDAGIGVENLIWTEYPHRLPELVELNARKLLRHNVCNHDFSRTEDELKITTGDGLTDVMEVDIDMFGTRVKHWVGGKLDGTLVIAVKDSRPKFLDVRTETNNR